MPPKKTTAPMKKSSSMSQPTLTFQTRKPSVPSPSKKGRKRKSAIVERQSTEEASEPELSREEETKRQVELAEAERKSGRRQLDVKSHQWDGLMADAKREMGNMKPIHASPETHDNVHHVLRVFDMSSKYGPSVGITRLQRWERAKKWGLNPPDEIRDILTTAQGEDDPSYRENVLSTWL